MSADDLAAAREDYDVVKWALAAGTAHGGSPQREKKARSALDRLAARLQEAERERQKADEELADKVGVEKALLDAEAREAALREAAELIRAYDQAGGNEWWEAHARLYAALAADDAP